MSDRCMAVIFSHPKRETYRLATTRALIHNTSELVEPPHLWTGDNVIDDWRALIRAPILDGCDLLYLEDDLLPCRNALRYMLDWRGPEWHGSPVMTSFYNPYRPTGWCFNGFIFSQAFKLPRLLVERMRIEAFPPPPRALAMDGVDNIVHRYLTRWSQPFWQHRSLVQHVGDVSTWTKSTLRGNGRKSIDWPGPDVDALTFRWT